MIEDHSERVSEETFNNCHECHTSVDLLVHCAAASALLAAALFAWEQIWVLSYKIQKGLRWGLNDEIEKVENTDNRNYRSTSVDFSSWLLVVTNLLQCGIRQTNVGTGRLNFVEFSPPLSFLQWQGGWQAADCGETWHRRHCSSLHSKLHETSTSGNPWPLLQTSTATLLKVPVC